MNIAVCDDEKTVREYMISLIKQQVPMAEIREYVSVQDYWEGDAFHDILFLDIETQPEREGAGMELAREIRCRKGIKQPVIIFVTGYEKYVYTAFDVGAFSYLLKPIDEKRFAEVFGRAVSCVEKEKVRTKKAFVVNCRGKRTTIALHQLYYAESQDHKVFLHMEHGVVTCYEKLKDLEKALPDCFFRIHRSYLLNLSFVKEYSRSEVVLQNGESLLLSKYKYDAFVKRYLDFLADSI